MDETLMKNESVVQFCTSSLPGNILVIMLVV